MAAGRGPCCWKPSSWSAAPARHRAARTSNGSAAFSSPLSVTSACKNVQEGPRPSVHIVGEDMAAQRSHAPPALLRIDLESLQQRALHALQIVRVDEERTGQLGRGASELG